MSHMVTGGTAPGQSVVATRSKLMTVEGLSRSFGEVHALKNVNLEFGEKEVVGLIGENGAGKSTLLNIMCGVDRPNQGEIQMLGRPVHFRSAYEATHHGVFRIFQDLSLVPSAAVYENLFLSHEAKFQRAGIIQTRRMKAKAAEVLERFGHGWIDPSRAVSQFNFSTRQVIEIIKSFALAELLDIETPLILLDEPTAGLSEQEVGFFYQLVRDVKDHAGIVFVSHRLSELLELSDRVYVMKDGAVVAQPNPSACTEEDLHFLMVGRSREGSFYKESLQRLPDEEVVLEISGFEQMAQFEDVNFSLHRGEILGLAGVMGSGKSELVRAVFGDGHHAKGSVSVNGVEVASQHVRKMIEAGVGYVAPDRAEGVLSSAPVSWNISLVALAVAERNLLISLGEEQRRARDQIARLSIKTPGPRTPAGHLSGGSQQKVILGRWLSTGVRVLILDNPTAGIDVGAREDIYVILREFVREGGAILLSSDDLVELVGLSNRILAMKDGRVVAEVSADANNKPEETELLKHMV